MFTERSTKNLPLFGFTILVFLVMILGCGGSGKTCVGTLTVDGKTYEGRDRVEAQARENACSMYCIEGDSGYDRMYQAFIKTPEAKKVNIDFNAENVSLKSKKWAALENERMNRYVDQCREGCLRQHNNGTRIIEVKCQ
ncbi:MAG: hypothetical protein IPI76_09445 [Chloracidobacterium sp.]|nr:hypothetical protein [Chloracidobacterium sp.]